MEHLHAYWRMEYIQAPKPETGGSPFAGLAASGNDRAALILHRRPHTFLILNRFPYNAGHLLALPYREVADLTDLSTEEASDLMAIVTDGKEILRRALQPDGYNIGLNLGRTAGAGIPSHLHFHIVPRWRGDTNFMPVIGNTRVLPQSLDAMWERLSAHPPAKRADT
ncbi:MAG: HIT domain-containing protein [Puniceicoccaceae bacterium]|nr:MAG: HIT domain-containing protein [Puniceicoccaceae bacterium]